MPPISGVNASASHPLTASGKVSGPNAGQESKENERTRAPIQDEYIPGKKQEPSGRYWLRKDENGQPAIYFDDPEQAEPDRPMEAPGAPDKKNADSQEDSCTCNTGKVDREIEKLKRKQKELEQRLQFETDSSKIKELEKSLTQVEAELRQKDNDAYRRRHAVLTYQ